MTKNKEKNQETENLNNVSSESSDTNNVKEKENINDIEGNKQDSPDENAKELIEEKVNIGQDNVIQESNLSALNNPNDSSVADSIPMTLNIILGKASMTFGNIRKLSKGAVIKLDRRVGDMLDIAVNDKVIARGELSRDDSNNINITIKEILS